MVYFPQGCNIRNKVFFLVSLFTSGTCSEERELIIIDSLALSCLRRRYIGKWEFKMFLQSDLSDHFNTGRPHTSCQRAFSFEQAHTTSLFLQLPVLTIFFNGLTLTVRQNGAVNLNLELGNPRTWAGHMCSPFSSEEGPCCDYNSCRRVLSIRRTPKYLPQSSLTAHLPMKILGPRARLGNQLTVTGLVSDRTWSYSCDWLFHCLSATCLRGLWGDKWSHSWENFISGDVSSCFKSWDL